MNIAADTADLKAQLYVHQRAPYPRGLGVEFLGWGGGRARLRLPFHERLATQDGARIDDRALLGLLDDLAAYAITSATQAQQGMSTLDLKVEFLHAPAPGAAVTADAKVTAIDGDAAFVETTATDEGGRACARSTTCFLLGPYPGQSPDAQGNGQADEGGLIAKYAKQLYAPDGVEGPYDRFMALTYAGPECHMAPQEQLIGWVGNPSYHGGVLGGLLASAASHGVQAAVRPGTRLRLASINIQFLRFAPWVPTIGRASIDRIGKRAAYATAVVLQGDGPPISQAQCMFVAAPGS
ncbi:PaaI family thioesterase [Zavarzinia sp. CC-PAN008]|uniref:PaaI family thioesterase n=1 Tax=Zavarzinia sp. CC-PAN008 TaxID=3243332 RepID=UPI003F748A36